jgi:histidine triad (HIT) family protein
VPETCIFCDIVAGRIPSDVVEETDNVLAFRDIAPAAPTHVLLIPKEHVADSAAELGPDDGPLLGELFALAAKIADAEGLDAGWRLVTNVGPAAGQTVFHVHFHLMGGWAAIPGL